MNARGSETGATTPQPCHDEGRGYQWKTVFLPHGTQLRIITLASTYYAQVDGDSIMYRGRSVSPRGFTLATAGEGRNAWRDLWLRFPGASHWKGANRCRIESAAVKPPALLTPAESLRSAALALTQALETALELVRQGGQSGALQSERRALRQRRESDMLGQDCAYD